MENYISYFLNKSNILRAFRYFCVASVFALGLVAIIATGGNRTSDDENNSGIASDDNPCSYNTDITCDGDYMKQCSANSGIPDNFMILNEKLIFTAVKGCKNSASTIICELDKTGSMKEIFESSSYILNYNESPQYISSLLILKDILYFSWGNFLYSFDGAGVKMISSEGIYPNIRLMAYNEKPCFAVNNKLYIYDGVQQVFLGDVGAEQYVSAHIVYKDRLYLVNTGALWCYDKNTAELQLVSDNVRVKGDFVIFKEKLYFTAKGGVKGDQLWMLDESDDPVTVTDLPVIELQSQLPDINNEIISSWAGQFTVFNGKLICAIREFNDSITGLYDTILFEYDGTANVTPITAENLYELNEHFQYSVLNDHFYFLAADPGSMQTYLWDYDGTSPPEKVNTGDSAISDMFLCNGKLTLIASVGDILLFDGVSNPEMLLKSSDSEMLVKFMTAFNGEYFATGSSAKYGSELWKINNAKVINLVEDFYPGTTCYCSWAF